MPGPHRLAPHVSVESAGGSRPDLWLEGARGTLHLRFEAVGGRVPLRLVLAPIGREVDVSIQPVLAARHLPAGPPGEEDRRAAVAWVRHRCRRHGVWSGAEGDLTRTLGGAAFPVLASAYDRGAATVAEIPTWAAPVLAAVDARGAATVLVGGPPGRRLPRALATALVPSPDRPPRFDLLALALMGAPGLRTDALVRVLDAGGAAAPAAPGGWPASDDVRRVQHLGLELGPRRLERLLTDAAQAEAGVDRVRQAAALLVGLPSAVRADLPLGLDRLHERCLELSPQDPRPEAPPVTGRPARAVRPGRPAVRRPAAPEPPVAPPAARAPAPAVPGRALAPPRLGGSAPAAPGPLPVHPRARGLHGQPLDARRRMVLPRTGHELRWWGQRLRSCIGDFGPAVASGQSVLVGIEVDDVLTYCAEVAPATATIRQALGRGNRPLPPEAAGALVRALVRAGLVDPAHPSNRPWVALAES